MWVFRYENETPEQLVRQCRAGDEEAFRCLFGRMVPLLKNRASRYAAACGVEPEDLVQEGAIGLHMAMMSYQEEKNVPFVAFASACVENRIRSAVRHAARKKRREPSELISLVELPDQLPDPDEKSDPERAAMHRADLAGLLLSASRSLSPMEQSVLHAFASGCSYQEIAAHLQRPQKSVDNALQRIRRKLRRALEEQS